jgi:hypothetical protein|tara:strand:- start:1399 stop:1665 length:267 start_codon:yes stop_codon:yes gene_type:complete
MLSQSIENSYLLLTGKATLEELLSYLTWTLVNEGKTPEDFNEDMLPVFFIEPGSSPTFDEIDEMIEHYEYHEEYEKCHFLKEFKKKLN